MLQIFRLREIFKTAYYHFEHFFASYQTWLARTLQPLYVTLEVYIKICLA